MASADIRSIAFKIFQRRLTAEVRSYWYCRTSFEYTKRWWEVEDKYKEMNLITQYPGDNITLFSSIDISPTEYLQCKDDVLWSVRGNALTNIVTAFETYLYYQTKRAIYINPSLIEESGIEFTAGEIASSFSHYDQQDWLAEQVVSKYIRNNSHSKMIKKIDKLIKGGLSNGEKVIIERWNRKVTLRNALIHNAKLINVELTKEWPEKFSKVGQAIQLDDGDIIRTQYVAYKLAQKIDDQFNRTVIAGNDAKLLARVAYLYKRDLTVGQIVDIVFKILNYPCTKGQVESAIAYQNRTRARIPDFTMMEELVIDYLKTYKTSAPSNQL
ncbi:hypothetical protein H0255_13140 [Pectobacterium versatile]|uniref:Uncharacterized protein n=1 Tax=Pectobacterium odoriferum TaxID=78398 RepID=A0ABR4VTR1_9GAMM|nr:MULTISPECIES: hypothetical protein [Pectobacterium]KGA42784.1 hypothetical protein KU75_02690 [Pectobacterium odoriferum]MBA0164078.1 hypothetical protein [Pectobacterium versatile]